MTIAMIGRYYNRQGGTARCMAELADRASREHAVDVYTHEVLDNAGSAARFIPVPMVSRPALAQPPSFGFALKRQFRARRYDVVHSHDPWPVADIYTAHSCYAAWLRQRRAEAGLLGMASRVYPPHLVRLWWSTRDSSAASSIIIAVSRRIKRELESEIGIDPRRVRVIYNGTNTDVFRPSESRLRALAELNDGCRPDRSAAVIALFVSYEFRKRGLGQLIRADAQLREPRLEAWIVGKDDPRPYRRLARQLGIAEKIKFLGHRVNIETYFRAADVFVLPTEYEAFGLVILEALASGTPVITSRAAGVAELVTDAREGFLLDDPADVEQLRAALQRYLEQRSRWPVMSAAARLLAEQHSWDSVWKQTSDVYRAVAAARSAGRPAWQA